MIKDYYLCRLVSAVHRGNSNEDYIHHINPAEHRARYSFHTKVSYFCKLGNNIFPGFYIIGTPCT